MTPHWLRLRIAVGSPAQGSVSPIKTMVQSGPYFLDLLDSSYLRVTGRWWNAKHDFVVAECCLRIWQVTGGIIYDVVILCYALGKKNKKNMTSGNWEFCNFNHVQLYSSSRLGGCQLVDVWADKPPVLNGKCHRSSSVNARLARSFTANWRWTQPHHGMCWTQRHPSAGPRASAIRSRWGSERKTQYLRRKWPQKNKSNSHHITSYNNPQKK